MSLIVDIVLIVVLVGYLVYGSRMGFVRSVGAIVGAVVGGAIAFFVVPLVGGFIPTSEWRTIATLAIVVALLVAGHAAGSSIGDSIARRVARGPVRVIDRLLGAAVNLVGAALVLLLVATSAAPLGVPFLSQALSSSAVLRTLDSVTPAPVQSLLAKARSIVVSDTIPSITDALGGVTSSPAVPRVDTSTSALTTASRSVVRISGNAYACGQNQSGSGFVFARGLVLTNAHVVAGVNETVVESPGGQALSGRVVYFDPTVDLAVVRVRGLSTPPIAIGERLAAGKDAVVDGYPFGGPFTSGAARVVSVGAERVENIYGSRTHNRDVYTIAANVQQGNSGGPLLATDGTVAGLVFAKSATTANVGYAMTVDEIEPAMADAAGRTARADTGACIRG